MLNRHDLDSFNHDSHKKLKGELKPKEKWTNCSYCKCPKCGKLTCQSTDTVRGDFEHYCYSCSNRWFVGGPDS